MLEASRLLRNFHAFFRRHRTEDYVALVVYLLRFPAHVFYNPFKARQFALTRECLYVPRESENSFKILILSFLFPICEQRQFVRCIFSDKERIRTELHNRPLA